MRLEGEREMLRSFMSWSQKLNAAGIEMTRSTTFDLRSAARRWRNLIRTRVWWRIRYGKRLSGGRWSRSR